MKAMVLGAGEGTRLRPLTYALPKPMVPVVGKPVIGHILDHLRHYGITDITINTQYLGERLQAGLGDGSAYGVSIAYSPEDQLWGDAGGLKRCEAAFLASDDPTLIVVGGDDLSDMDFGKIIATHRERGATCTIGVKRVADTSQFGVAVTDANGYITRFQEKPKPGEALSDLANTGVYVFDRKVFDVIPPNTPFGFGKDVLPALLAAGEPMCAVVTEAYWQDVGNLTIYRQAQRDCLDGRVQVQFPDGARTDDHCFVVAGAQVEGTIADYTVVGRGCVIEPGATVINSVLWDGARVRTGAHVENCVIGSGVTVEPGAVFNGHLLNVSLHRPS